MSLRAAAVRRNSFAVAYEGRRRRSSPRQSPLGSDRKGTLAFAVIEAICPLRDGTGSVHLRNVR
jgi:hypothetical protein